ncbi:zinc-dependent alcohol dehydrogenase family protein [Sanguibacter inulinus]|uniref:Zinc-dependent alcohol dehydrogenase family protein n=1 Tax=Sanguibacter inulinus TaxID=60922 RepID=A0A853EP51_9MICO|nr:zinc-dependent alcohol dehydrogenase family protein [Sanguibacter inulinus]MBF0721166.1 zinc-dependent alcohol dehydrogenase family protein [Sanguibacter inulinus]NYS92311.1 zinc-dependent alcohol dehydrogenase family protein [Sanguibacter inulinus]
MRAVMIQQFGDPSGMAVVELPPPVPQSAHLVVQTEAIGVGGVDAVVRRGALGPAFSEGMILGSEVAGTVSSVGAGVDPAWVGRRVWAFTGTSGGYAEQAVARADDVVELPDGLSSVDAVTVGGAATVAQLALTHAHLRAGESLLVRGAAGSIGIAAVELGVRAGASIVAVTTSSQERGDRLRALGATHVLDRDGRAEDGGSATFDVIVDIAGGAALPDFVDRLAPNGRMVLLGVVAGFPPADFGARLLSTFQQSRSFATFSLDSVPASVRDPVRAAQLAAASRGELHAVVDDVLPLAQAADAHRRMDLGSVFGRIVLVP